MSAKPQQGEAFADLGALVEVAVPLPLDQSLTYRLPRELAGQARLGQAVLVPVGRRRLVGYLLGAAAEIPAVRLKEVLAILDPVPRFDAALLAFYSWLAQYYHHPLGEVLQTAIPDLPSGRQPAQERWLALAPGVDPAKLPGRAGTKAQAILELLAAQGSLPLAELAQQLPRPQDAVRRLAQQGLVVIEMRPRSHASVMPASAAASARPPVLTPHQEQAVQAIGNALARQVFAPFLLHGVTASGKTEVYLQAAAAALEQGRGVLVLLPEIALTDPVAQAFQARFGHRVALLHSGLSPAARLAQWRRLAQGEMQIVVGARSAVFAPLPQLGLIVVDEEHDPAYKNEGGLPYQARDAALYRGHQARATVILGSATPAITTFYHAQEGKYQYLSLPERATPQPLPQIHLIDLRQHREGRRLPVLSAPVRLALQETLARGEQALLFLNRRGYANVFFCLFCGHIRQCPACSVTLTLHRQAGRLRCHYCGYQEDIPELCPECQSAALKHHGLGTERLEKEVQALFPQARLGRLDRDTATTSRRVQAILEDLRQHRLDILIGTQMITKGHDFPQVTLVGVVQADLSLYFPEYHAGERTFQLLTQVAGRAGRGDRPGQVFIQTCHPEHPALQATRRQDYQAFYQTELAARQELGYPPYTRLALLTLQSKNADRAAKAAAAMAQQLQAILAQEDLTAYVRLLGPAPAPRSRLKEYYRWQILVKSYGRHALATLLAAVRPLAAKKFGAAVALRVDVDPVGMQ
ncbi:MAG: replication restart helicase PriA [Desulfobacca sp.]|uniref:replication restart helicase PriA n=1 Tax=Desulfobacca sp. TaxID=2067990 RepID=UPI004049B6AF